MYQNSLLIALDARHLRAQAQVPLKVMFRGTIVGEFVADIVVEDEVVVELKSVSSLLAEHQAQLINYLQATRLKTGLLVNFGTPRLQYKRCFNS